MSFQVSTFRCNRCSICTGLLTVRFPCEENYRVSRVEVKKTCYSCAFFWSVRKTTTSTLFFQSGIVEINNWRQKWLMIAILLFKKFFKNCRLVANPKNWKNLIAPETSKSIPFFNVNQKINQQCESLKLASLHTLLAQSSSWGH